VISLDMLQKILIGHSRCGANYSFLSKLNLCDSSSQLLPLKPYFC
jgi:hypothetical protein